MRCFHMLAVVLLAMPAPVMAVDQVDSVTWGVRAGGNMPNYTGADFAGIVGAGVVYRHREFESLALEADVSATLIDGDIGGFDYSVTTLSAYLAWRTAGKLYLKLRAGSVMEYVSVGPSDVFGGGISGSIGAGLRRGEQLLELELTGVDKSAYTVTLNWYF